MEGKRIRRKFRRKEVVKMIVNYRWVLKDLFGLDAETISTMSDDECKEKAIELSNDNSGKGVSIES